MKKYLSKFSVLLICTYLFSNEALTPSRQLFLREFLGTKLSVNIHRESDSLSCKYCNEVFTDCELSLQHVFGCNCLKFLCCRNHDHLTHCPECGAKKNEIKAAKYYQASLDFAKYVKENGVMPSDINWVNPNFSLPARDGVTTLAESIDWPICVLVKKNFELIPRLLQYGASCNLTNDQGYSPLVSLLMKLQNPETGKDRNVIRCVAKKIIYHNKINNGLVFSLNSNPEEYSLGYLIGRYLPEILPFAMKKGLTLEYDDAPLSDKTRCLSDGLILSGIERNQVFKMPLFFSKNGIPVSQSNLEVSLPYFTLLRVLINFGITPDSGLVSLAYKNNYFMSFALIKSIISARDSAYSFDVVHATSVEQNYMQALKEETFSLGAESIGEDDLSIVPPEINKYMFDAEISTAEIDEWLQKKKEKKEVISFKDRLNGNLTPLQMAVIQHRDRKVKLLLAYGANKLEENSIGENACTINSRLCRYYFNRFRKLSKMELNEDVFAEKRKIRDLYSSQLIIKKSLKWPINFTS